MKRSVIGGAAGLLTCLLLMVAVGHSSPQKRVDPAVADSMVQAGLDPLAAADILSLAWEHEQSLHQLARAETVTADVLWRQARANIDMGENLEGSAGEANFLRAMELAEEAIRLDPNSADAHLMLSIAAGRVALLRGPFKAPGLVKQAYFEAHLAAALGDSIPVATYVIGRTHKKLMEKSPVIRAVAGLSFASADSIPIYFERTLETCDGNMIQCHVEYADYLMNTAKDKQKAREHCEAALALPLRDEQDQKAQKWATEMLQKL